MWRGRAVERRGQEPREPSVAALVIVGVVVGAILSAWWSVDRSRDRSGQAANLTSVAPVSWPVSPARPWEASIVRVATTQCLDGGVHNEIAGTGVIVDGHVITNHHVVDHASSVVVTTHDGVEHRVDRLEASTRIDLARLEVAGLDEGLTLVGRGGGEARQAPLSLAGFPDGDRYDVRRTSVVGTVQGWGYPDPEAALHLDADVIPGESGSPLIDADGDVVALLYARALSDGNGLAIDADEVSFELDRLASLSFESC